MCIAIFKSPNSVISDVHLRNSWLRNSDGAGFATVKGGKVVVQKGFMDYDSFIAAYKESVSPEEIALVHFRIKSAGKVTPENCHPWVVGSPETSELCFIHNGTFRDFADGSSDVSDTGIFRDEYLNEVIKTHGYKFPFVSWINYSIKSIADSSRLVFLDKDGDATIINEDLGVWEGGCWFSNESFKNPPAKNHSSHFRASVPAGFYQAYRIKVGKDQVQVLYGAELHAFLSKQHHIKGKNEKKLKKLLKAGIAEQILIHE